jgi:hypothetical protein
VGLGGTGAPSLNRAGTVAENPEVLALALPVPTFNVKTSNAIATTKVKSVLLK